jgi:DNA processing protein
VFEPQPFENPLRGVPLLRRCRLVGLQDRVDDRYEQSELRPLRRLGSHITGRRRIAAHLGNRVSAQSENPRRLAPALPFDEDKPSLSIHGRQTSAALARAGHVIVSGLARGIDARAHQAAIETGTIAVVAGGLGKIYPADHEALLERLLEQGAAISEMPFGWEARGRDFPRRNRIVAGLCRAVVVVEAARRSGSLITAKFAADEGREIFAVPGSPLDPRAEGANDLLRDGATFCTRAEDVIEALAEQNLSRTQTVTGFFEPGFVGRGYEPLWDELDLPEVGAAPFEPVPANREDGASPDERDGAAAAPLMKPPGRPRDDIERRLIALLGPVPVSVDELARASEAPAREVRTVLLGLKLAGRIEWHGGDLVSSLPASWPRANDHEE